MSTDYAMKLREIRKAEGLTQKQFSDLSGISLGTIKNTRPANIKPVSKP